jgi:formylglycine-generating enzyme required for sulfatase activity
MKIFISYRRAEDNLTYLVGQIYEKLAAVFQAANVFRDIYDIAGGEDWRSVLARAVDECQVMLVVMGPGWANLAYPSGEKRLFDNQDITRWEVETGLRRHRDRELTLIPVLVTDAAVPNATDLPEPLQGLVNIQAVRLRNYPDFNNDMDRLIRAIWKSQGYHPVEATEYFEPKSVYIAEGLFTMGSQPAAGIPDYETPQHAVNLPAFCIGIDPVTNEQYDFFIRESGTPVSPILGWDGQTFPLGKELYPVTGVTWYEALAYCRWLSEKTNRKYSLPNEAQWEKACRGRQDSCYPWGNEFDPQRCNYGSPGVAPVDAHLPQNEFGCRDLVGNVLQWTVTQWGKDRFSPSGFSRFPWRDDMRNDLGASQEVRRVVRGCSMQDPIPAHRCSLRRSEAPDQRGFRGARMGFRVLLEVE